MGEEKSMAVLDLIKKVNTDMDEKEDAKTWEQLLTSQPFAFLEEKLGEQERELIELKQAVAMLRRHQHTKQGEVCVPL
jgi:type I site-specific restriction endonuclease